MAKQKDEQTVDKSIDQHYGRGDLLAKIDAGLLAAGKDPDAAAMEDLAPVDQFHTRGKASTLELIGRAGIKAGMQVLDVGGGIGGTARILASEYNCNVIVLDLTAEFCRTGEALTARMSLSDRVTFRHASALDMPFPDASFDLAWSQHSTMNIADKERLYAEIFRVLRPSGRYAFYEVMAGAVSPIYFPVPWAGEQEISYLRAPAAVRTQLGQTGFQELSWMDDTPAALTWFQERAAAPATAPPLGLQQILGGDLPAMFANYTRNLVEQRVTVIQGVFERPSG